MAESAARVTTVIDVLIAYTSTSGTTAKVSEAIVEGLESAGANATAIRIDRLAMMPSRIASADVLGIGAPVYFLREPSYVSRFIADLPPLGGRRGFIFCCAGMNRVGESLYRLHDSLVDRELTVVGAEWFPTAMSYPPYRSQGLGNREEKPDDEVLAAARAYGVRLASASELGPVTLPNVGVATRFKARLLAQEGFRRMLLPGIRLNTNLCTGYGSCISRCPFEALDRDEDEDTIPTVGDECIRCLQCIDSCPRAAIEVDSPFKARLGALLYRLGIH